MKRYRVLLIEFDTRVNFLTMEIPDEWDDKVKEGHLDIRQKIQEQIINKYGVLNFQQKRQNYIDLGQKPWSILKFHNKFQNQVREAFINEAYYPALTAACALGERILNHLLLTLRDYYSSSPYYKKVYDKKSFDNWEFAIQVLESWAVLLPEVVHLFFELNKLRNRSIHFNPDTDSNDRELALEAINCLGEIIQKQFGSLGDEPWFIPGFAGEHYIRKSAETEPFVKEIYLPNCAYVGPNHQIVNISINMHYSIQDDDDYEDREISDEEFRELRQARK
ncbi:MAG: hypothetical protein FVQ83_08785 [Chloroflexi bacterium]|nr:hypothetical protein [Chloroflexota bacterium]